MKRLRCNRALVRTVAAAVLLSPVWGCYSWRVEPLAPEDVIPEAPEGVVRSSEVSQRKHVIRITRTDGSEVVVSRPFIWQDSIQGTVLELPANVQMPLALTDVERLEVQEIDTGRTLLAAVVAPVGLMVGIAIVSWLVLSPDFSN